MPSKQTPRKGNGENRTQIQVIMDIKALCGISLAIIVGVARITGGVISILSPASLAEYGVGFGLLAVGAFLIFSAIMLWIKKNAFWVNMLTLAAILFWLGGLINGFILYGQPQRSGQIINICCVICIVTMTRGIEDREETEDVEKLDLTQLRKK